MHDVQRLHAFMYELVPTGEQTSPMRSFAGWGKLSTGWCPGVEVPRLASVPILPLQQTPKDEELLCAPGARQMVFLHPDGECGRATVVRRRRSCIGIGVARSRAWRLASRTTVMSSVGSMYSVRMGHARCACPLSGTARPRAAGTHRSDSGSSQCRT
jgi:hypothetical protein